VDNTNKNNDFVSEIPISYLNKFILNKKDIYSNDECKKIKEILLNNYK
jgi:hypothetical protein